MPDPTLSLAQIPAAPASARARRRLGLSLALSALLVLPFLLSDYRVFQLTLVIATAIALLGLNLLTGFNGQISLGHGAFFAIGSYCTAILIERASLPYWLAIPAAGVACLGFGMLFGLPALRLEGLYLALATYALGVALPQLLKYRGIEQFTGGVQGTTLIKPSPPFGLPISSDRWLYLLSLAILVVFLLGAHNLLKSHAGRAIVAIRDQPIAAAAMGVDVARYKTITFGVSAMCTGVAGALHALAVQFIAPDSFSFISLDLLVGIVVGGLASLPGAIYGALFIRFLPLVTEELSKSVTGAIYGLVMIVCILWMPFGIAGFIAQLSARVSASHRRDHD